MKIIADTRHLGAPGLGFVTVGFNWGTYAALVPMLKAQLGVTDDVFGTAMLLSGVGASLAMLAAPWLSGRLGSYAMVVPSILMAVLFLVPASTASVILFAAGLCLTSMSSGTLDVIMNAKLSLIEESQKRPLMNLAHGVFSFAYAAAAISGGILREAGFGAWHIALIMGAVNVALSLMMRHEATVSQDKSTPNKRRIQPWIIILGLITMISFIAEQATESWSALYIERDMNGGAAQGALGPAILGLTMGVGRLSGQFWVRHFSEMRCIVVASLISAAGLLVVSFAPSLNIVYLGFVFMGLGVSVVVPMSFAYAGKHCSASARTQVISLLAAMGYGGFFIGPPLMGMVSEHSGLDASFAMIAAMLIFVACVLVPLLNIVMARARA